MNTQKIIFIILIAANFYFCKAQCIVPNGDFESFEQVADTTPYAGYVEYYLPNGGWTESLPGNLIPRNFRGEGFFGKYEGDDAEGSALLLTRGVENGVRTSENTGFIIIECDSLPSTLIGDYKFSGSNLNSVPDFFHIGVYAYKDTDVIIPDDLDPHFSQFESGLFTWITLNPTDSFLDFEVNLSDFANQDINRIMIQLVMTADLGDFILTPDYASAVIDNVAFVYESLSINDVGFDNNFKVYPNPTSDVIYIKSDEGIVNIEIYNALGSLVATKQNDTKINVENLTSGIYYLSVRKKNNQIISRKFVKK
ncbi:T9SS type A sorting domain-containing protein [uncultured Winogradskyella sp.]|uniref:T9SS type A sorting domain-containing protein n=1 Tax=uncultured Winogradskyella sp. TaxID=395353 RepID=UPI002614647E|nr:T9SS type A sorting domain-containing protein [uncultured Winogradskyella sp.]